MNETLLQKAQRLGIKPDVSPTSSTIPSVDVSNNSVPESLLAKAKRLGIKPDNSPLQLSDMPGVLGAIGSGVYNAGKGLLTLGKDVAVDTFNAINHPIDSAVNVGKFLGGELQGGADPNTLDSLGKVAQSTVGSKGLLGVAQLPGRVIDKALNPNDSTLTQGQIGGTVLNSALTALTFGTGQIASQAVEQSVKQGLMTSTVGQALKNFTGSFVGRALEAGTINTGFQAGSNLQEGVPVTQDLKQAFFAGAVTPGIIQGSGKVLGKVTPSINTIESGAKQLKSAIGFRGNIKEKPFYDNAVPVVYKSLKDSGFKLTSATDPNNLIKLDDAINTKMTSILEERTKRIEATGGNATIDGGLAAEEIRNLVERNSVEDLINPSVRENLDAIAKNFESKQYTPVEAQKAIIQANGGFTLSDNPAMSKQIKMAISKAFTPELDRIVAGSDKVNYGQKGGTGELNKQWSAFKQVNEQLQKKLNLEERKAINSLPDRLTYPEMAGMVGEAIGNPALVTQKITGAGFSYLANKILGDRNNVNYRIYKAFNGQPIGLGIVTLLNKFTKASDLVKLLEQNPIIQHLLEKILPQDNTLQAKENLIPNRQGGFVAIGGKEVKVTPEIAQNIYKELKKGDFINMNKVNGTSEILSVDKTFKLSQLQDKLQKNGKLSSNDLDFAAQTLQDLGYDVMPKTPNVSPSLISEAKKYKSAEEFVKSKGKPLFHGTTNKDFTIDSTRILYTSESKAVANKYGSNLVELYPNQDINILKTDSPLWKDTLGKSTSEAGDKNALTKIKNVGYDVVYDLNDEQIILNYSKFKTKSQLTDIWNKANKK